MEGPNGEKLNPDLLDSYFVEENAQTRFIKWYRKIDEHTVENYHKLLKSMHESLVEKKSNK